MLSVQKDSTISSKMSDYDNVPVLDRNYHNHTGPTPGGGGEYHHTHLNHTDLVPDGDYHNHINLNDLASPMTIFSGFLDDPPSSVSTQQVLLATPSLPQHCHHHHHHHQHQQQQTASPRPLPFPTEENQELGGGQQPLEQRGYGTLDQGGSLHQQTTPRTIKTQLEIRERSHRDSYGGEMSTGSSIVFYFLVFLAEILMFGLLSLVLFWSVYYRGGFGWRDEVHLEFNFHPVLMICGFVFFLGHAMLVYRLFRCCNKLTAKILHTFLCLMAVPCIVVATITVFDSHNLRNPPIPNLYSLHSWLGLITIGLFTLQLVVGFFSFWLLLCCEQGTAKFRSGLVPVHTTFGIITFMLAIATAVTGYTEKAFFVLSTKELTMLVNEAWVINAQAAGLAGLAIVMGFLLYSSRYARSSHPVAIIDPPSNSHYVMTQKSYYYRDHE
ncbi:plasma membrane ascorbate-dependent reductase CYBRD1-like isoform X2 [Panulirus ornatus]|uniref:plasma membrane ascorbate-dependent reductase CYBRD1-like isoform X2 n=1 Tax=Panulirus ornatus TaxID=150431 RepID=UPI003A855B9D